MHPTRLDREKSTDQCVTSCSGAGLNLGTIKTRSRPIMSREGVNQSPYDPFSSQSRPQSLGQSHAPVGGEQRLPRTVSAPSMLNPRPLILQASWQPSYQSSMTAECGCLCRRHPKQTPSSFWRHRAHLDHALRRPCWPPYRAWRPSPLLRKSMVPPGAALCCWNPLPPLSP